MAFDFFNISGSLFVETTTDSSIRSSAQGLFMMMTNGVGAWLGSIISGWVIGKYFILPGGKQRLAWYLAFFCGYALVVAFCLLFSLNTNTIQTKLGTYNIKKTL
jgi:NHS family xanthosine MFS transporter